MRTVTAVALAAGCLAWVAGQALLPDMGLEWAERLAAVADARGSQALSTALLLVAGASFVVAATGLVAAAPAARGRRLVVAGAVLLGLGGVWLAAGRAAFNLSMLKATHPSVPREAGLAVVSAPDSPAFVVFPLCLLALLVGPVLLAVGMRSWVPLGLWVAGIGAFVATEFTVKLGEVAGLTLACAGLLWAGLAVLVSADRGWNTATHSRATATRTGSPEPTVPAEPSRTGP